MLTNTLLLYMTQEALAKARAKLHARKDDGAPKTDTPREPPVWQAPRRATGKLRVPLRH
jgi:hypothetical protein